MKFNFSKDHIGRILCYVLSGIIIISFYHFVNNYTSFLNFLSKVIGILMPFIIGFSLAFLLFPIVRYIENLLNDHYNFKNSKTGRYIALLITMILFFIILISFFSIVLPEIFDSAVILSSQIIQYSENIDETIDLLINKLHIPEPVLHNFFELLKEFLNEFVMIIQDILPHIVSYSFKIVNTIFNFVLGIVISIYIMADRERFYYHMHKLTNYVLGEEKTSRLVQLSNLSSKMFNNFIVGKLIDSLIIGIICFICMNLFKFDFALLISFIVGCTNIIPVFGPFIGAIPSFFILLIINPIEALWFILFIFVLQQFDGNILGPKILGESMGIPTLYILFAIIVGGGLFGVLGMFLSVPIFSLIYAIISQIVNSKQSAL